MSLSEADTKAKLIKPNLLQKYNWKEDFLNREYKIAQDRFFVKGEDYKRLDTAKFADYVLNYNNTIVSVLEAKAENKDVQKHLSQVQDYAKRLDVPIAYISNGHKTLIYDRRKPQTREVDSLLTPEEIFEIYKNWKDLKEETTNPVTYPQYEDKSKEERAFQDTAIKKVVEDIAKGERRNLLTMATGTGKTYVASQIIWKLVKSGFFSKVLYLTDRTFLRDDAARRDFKEFGDGREIIKHKNFNKNRDVYFSTYQTLYVDNFYEEIPHDFFDLIIIDECHRSRYKDWGDILDHFDTAYHLGMTATPEREDNIDVYNYFGKPAFQYSLGKAIEDGFLVPYKIYKITTNLYKEGFDIDQAEEIIYDDEAGSREANKNYKAKEIKKHYEPSEFETTVNIPDQIELLCKKLINILKKTDPYGATIVFCTDMAHAQKVKDKLNEIKEEENFATRVVSEDKENFSKFRDNEMPKPVIATTVDLLSTGIDIPHLQNIVFMRRINSHVLFKQIIGRGSRLFEGKGFFRIIDFTNATRLIDEWDTPKEPPKEIREPQKPFDKVISGTVIDEETEDPIIEAQVRAQVGRWSKSTITDETGAFDIYQVPSNETIEVSANKEDYRKKTKKTAPQEQKDRNANIIKLSTTSSAPKKIKAEGVNVFFKEEIEIELKGKKMSFAEYKKYSGENVNEMVQNSEELKDIWTNPKKKEDFIEELEDKNVNIEMIKTLGNMNEHDGFDILAHLAFEAPLLTRQDRTKLFLRNNQERLQNQGEEIREAVSKVLDKYEHKGEQNLSKKVFVMPGMYEAKKKVKENFSGGVSGFMKLIRNNIYRLSLNEQN